MMRMKVSPRSVLIRWELLLAFPNSHTGQYNNTYQITDNFSKIIGRHTLKFGGDVRYIQINERNTYTSNGWFTFSGSETETILPTS